MDTKTPIKRFVTYLRVSTDKQGLSGLGLEAQVDSIKRFVGDGEVLGEFTEIESGKNSERPKLVEAMLLARKTGATLVIAKLDRLSRNVHFISGLLESGVEFVAADNPYANRLTIHILAAVAEDEARRISERTKAALKALKARGLPLGAARTPAALEAARAKGLMMRADGRERSMSPSFHRNVAALERGRETMHKAYLESLRREYGTLLDDLERRHKCGQSFWKLAAWLNQQKRKTLKGCQWSASAVWRVLKILERERRSLATPNGCATCG